MPRSLGVRRAGLAVALVALVLAALACLGLPSATAGASGSPRSDRSRSVLHRVVWDDYRKGRPGLHLWSAERNGSAARRIFVSERGFTVALVLDRQGRRVAFSLCRRQCLPVVVPVDGGHTQYPLAHHPRIYFVGGIGWAPNGSRLAFEGCTDRNGHPACALWKVRPNGRHLRRVLRLPPPRSSASWINDALAWTRQGILYSDGHDLRAARAGRSHVVIRWVQDVRITGDGRHLVTTRVRDHRVSVWWSERDGSHGRRLLTAPRLQSPPYDDITPDYHGRYLLGWTSDAESSADVVWHRGSPPSGGRTLAFVGGNTPATWN